MPSVVNSRETSQSKVLVFVEWLQPSTQSSNLFTPFGQLMKQAQNGNL